MVFPWLLSDCHLQEVAFQWSPGSMQGTNADGIVVVLLGGYLFQGTVDTGSPDAEQFGDVGWPYAFRPKTADLSDIDVRLPAFIYTSTLCSGDAFHLPLSAKVRLEFSKRASREPAKAGMWSMIGVVVGPGWERRSGMAQ